MRQPKVFWRGMRSDPERNWNPSRCATCSAHFILSHSRSISINKALRHRGDQVPEFKQEDRNLGFSLFSLSLQHFSSSAFVSVSTRFFCLSDFNISALRICTLAHLFVGKRVGYMACLGSEASFCPSTAKTSSLLVCTLRFGCVNRCTDVIPGKLPLSLVLQLFCSGLLHAASS